MHLDPEHHIEPRKVGHRWFDAGITIAILLVSVSSLIVAVVHSRTLERMANANARLVEANSWPSLSYNTDNGRTISMSIDNNGIGPAKIETIEVKWAGRPVPDAVAFLKACCRFIPRTGEVTYALIAGKVLRAGQSINILGLPLTPADEASSKLLDKMRLSPQLSVDVCYCSIFDQCWSEDVVRFSLSPRQVQHCTIPAVPYGIPR